MVTMDYSVFELPGKFGGVEPPTVFSTSPNTLSNYALGGQLYNICIRLTSQFWSLSNHREARPVVIQALGLFIVNRW